MNENEIYEQIKNSRKYKDLSKEIIIKEIREYIKRNPNYKEYKKKRILKEIKANLHKIYGSFQLKRKKLRENYLKERNFEAILTTNLSTKERLKVYKKLYELIFSVTGKPKSILDLGAGINPLSIIYMKDVNIKNLKYYAYDINEANVNLVNDFFRIKGMQGRAQIIDLSKIENIKKLPYADICFMFKIIDPLEKGKGHKLSEKIIKILKCKYIVASFATKTLSGRKMRHPYRGWIERMLDRNRFEWKKINTENEVFYIIKK